MKELCTIVVNGFERVRQSKNSNKTITNNIIIVMIVIFLTD